MKKEYYWDIANRTQMGKYLIRKEIGVLDMFFKKGNRRSCLDIGGGSGKVALPLLRRGYRVTIVEPERLATKRFKRKKGLTLINKRFDETKFKTNEFNNLFLIEVLGYFGDKDGLFKECKKILKPGGLMVLTLDNRSSYKSILHKINKKEECFYTHSYRQIISLLEKEGFKTLFSRGFSWIPFGRASNSFLIPWIEKVESIFGLKYLKNISPYVLIVCEKK